MEEQWQQEIKTTINGKGAGSFQEAYRYSWVTVTKAKTFDTVQWRIMGWDIPMSKAIWKSEV
jgi:hypothetical protein